MARVSRHHAAGMRALFFGDYCLSHFSGQLPVNKPPTFSDTYSMKFAGTKAILAILLVFCASLAFSQDRLETARIYSRHALESLAAGDLDSAVTLATRSLDFSREIADPWYVLAVARQRQSVYPEAWEAIQAAMDRMSTHIISRNRIVTAYLMQLFQRKMYDTIIDLQLGARNPGESLLLQPDTAYYLLRAVQEAGRRSEFAGWFATALANFRDNTSFRMLVEPDDFRPPAVVDRMLRSAPRDYYFLDSLERLLFRFEEGSVRREWVEWLVRERGRGDSELVFLYLIDSAPSQGGGTPGAPASFAAVHLDGNMRGLREIIAHFPGTVYAQMALDVLRDPTVPKYADTNRDGYAEEEFNFVNGRLAGWSLDWNQDGYPELAVEFDGQVPIRAEVLQSGGVYEILYSDYPLVSEVRQVSGGGPGSTAWMLDPLQIELPVFSGIVPLGDSAGPLLDPVPGSDFSVRFAGFAETLEERSYLWTQVDPAGIVQFRPGSTARYSRVDREGNFAFDRFNLVFPERLWRFEFLDLDEDGWFEFVRLPETDGLYLRHRNQSHGEFVPYFGVLPAAPPSQELIAVAENYQLVLFERSGK